MPAKRFGQQKTILITGVSRGLGRVLASTFARLGHSVIGCGRAVAELDTLRSLLGSAHRIDVVDVGSNAEVADWAKVVLKEKRPPDLLINNAAVINGNAKLWQVTADEFDRCLAINVGGVANVIRNFVPAMIDCNRGVIVNLSSGWGRSASADVAPYCATKWAIEGLTLALAAELPDGMCAASLNPGIINTEMLQSCFASGAAFYPAPADWVKRAVPLLLSLGPEHNGRQLTVPD